MLKASGPPSDLICCKRFCCLVSVSVGSLVENAADASATAAAAAADEKRGDVVLEGLARVAM